MKCVICKTPIQPYSINKYYPFCSELCRNIDLYNWLCNDDENEQGEEYVHKKD